MEEMRHMPGYTSILKAVLKSQIQHLVDQLAKETQEESLVVTACLDDGTFSHLGSKSGKDFLHDNTEMKTNFLGFCIKKKYRPKSPLTLDADYPPAQSPHPVTLCKVAGQSVVPLEQQKWSYHPQHNLPGKSKISGSQRHVPYKTKVKQKAQTCSYQEQSGMSSSESREDYPLDCVKDNDSNAPSLGETNGDVSIKVERFDNSDEQLDEDTAVDSESDANYNVPAPRNKSASTSATILAFESESASGLSSDLSPTSGGTSSSVENHIATKTVSLPPSLDMNPLSQESGSLVNQDSNFSIKLETSFDLYDQEESGAIVGGLHHTETENTKMQLSTQDSQSTEEKKTEETGPNPEEYLVCKKKKLSQTADINQLEKEFLEEKKYVPETRHENSMYVESEVYHPHISASDQPSQCRNSTASKQPTFIARNESDKEKLVNEMRSLNTIKKNESAIRQFQSTSEKYVCKYCGEGLRSSSDLSDHEKAHTEMAPYKCCGKLYFSKGNLYCHRCAKHGKNMPDSCEDCGKTFPLRTDVLKHMKSQTEGEFKCQECGLQIRERSQYKDHVSMHQLEKRHVCECGKAYSHSSSLCRHRRVCQKDKDTWRSSSVTVLSGWSGALAPPPVELYNANLQALNLLVQNGKLHPNPTSAVN